MKKNIVFFILLLVFAIVLFSFLYLIGFLNLFESNFIKNIKLLDFTFLGKSITIIYFVIITIFLIIVIALMIRLIISLKQDNLQLTSMNVDELSIQKNGSEDITNSFDKLVSSLDKNINAIQKYTEVIDNDMDKINHLKIENTIQENIDSLCQDFSQLINDIIQSNTISELFEKILFWGVRFSNSRRGSLMVVDKNKELYIYKTIGWSENEKQRVDDIKIPLGTGIAGKVAAENKRIFVTNIENYEEYDFKYKDKYETKSFISLPIFGTKKVVAVLNLTDNKKGLYTMNDLEIINIITRLSSKIFELIQIKKKMFK
ncbi:MAG: GAF domain-containing protein [Spirochaetes bacterium]|nr:GAF domain-containing protein [Spirochaetota bacterium]